MSTRITQELRNAIVMHLLNHRFAKDRKAIKDRDNIFAAGVYTAAYSAKIRKQMDDLPDGWLGVASQLRFTIGNTSYAVGLANVVRILAVDQHGSVAKFKADSQVAVKWKQLTEDRQALSARERECRDEARATIGQFSTTTALVKAWPEIEPFLAKVGASTKTKNLPARIPADLNKKLDLPV